MGPILGNEKLLDALFSSIRQNRLAGCYILEGAKGTGKRSIARFVAASLLCPNRNAKGEACLQCPSCRRVLAGNHIDVFELTPEEKGKRIPVSAVREMLRNSYVLPCEGDWRIFILCDSEAMKKEAQNALLKSIEEPRDQTVFFLLTADASRLLPTVRSRAVKFKTEPLPKDVIREALKENKPASEISEEAILLCGGSLGRALEILGDAEFHAARQVVLKYFEALFSGASFTKLCLIVSPAEWSRAKFSIILPMVKLALRDLICAHFGFDFSPEFFTNSAFLHDFAEIISPTEAIRLYEMTEALEGATEQNANLYAMLSTFHLRFQKLTQSLA